MPENMTRIVETYDIMVCADCAHAIANGCLPDDSIWIEEIYNEHIEEVWGDGHFFLCQDSEEWDCLDEPFYNPFSWSSCEMCLNDQGGERYAAIFNQFGHDYVTE